MFPVYLKIQVRYVHFVGRHEFMQDVVEMLILGDNPRVRADAFFFEYLLLHNGRGLRADALILGYLLVSPKAKS